MTEKRNIVWLERGKFFVLPLTLTLSHKGRGNKEGGANAPLGGLFP
jgi:hypothetical protein